MDVLHDQEFIITTITTITICFVSSIITIWLARRIPVELPIGYETLKIEEIRDEENIKAIKAKMQMLVDNETSDPLCLFVFKIWNRGKKPVWLSDPTPLIITFKQGVKILGWERAECKPDHIKVSPTVEEREVKLDLPFLDSKYSVTVYLLLNEYVDYLPDVHSEVHHNGKNNVIRANNIRSSKENIIAGIIAFGIGAYSLISYDSSFRGPVDALINVNVALGFYLVLGIGLLYKGIVERRNVPHNFLLSRIIVDKIKEFLPILPYLVIIVGIGIAIYSFFGRRIFIDCVFTLITFVLPIMLWSIIYSVLNWIFNKLIIKRNLILVIILSGILPVAIFLYFLSFTVLFWTN